MMKILLLATIATSAILASCTQLNADEQDVKLRNQGCYSVIETHLADRAEPLQVYASETPETFTIQYWWSEGGGTNFIHDKIKDICVID